MRFRTGKQHIAWPGVARVTEGMRTDVMRKSIYYQWFERELERHSRNPSSSKKDEHAPDRAPGVSVVFLHRAGCANINQAFRPRGGRRYRRGTELLPFQIDDAGFARTFDAGVPGMDPR